MNIPFEIRGYPMPPSNNELYANNARTGGRMKSMKYKAYEEEVKYWTYKNGYQLQSARMIIQKMLPNEVFHVERFFYHKSWRIITKAGKPVKNDTSNRIKALDDTLSQLLGIDDSYFWSGTYTKDSSPHISLGEYVDLKFTKLSISIKPEEETKA